MQPGQHLQVRRARLRHRAARPPAARPGRQLQEHDRPPAQEGAGALLAHRRGRALHLRLDARRRPTATRPCADCPMHEEPLHLIPLEIRADGRRRSSTQGRDRAATTITIEGDLCPFCRQMFNERLAAVRRRLERRCSSDVKVCRLILSEKDRIGIGTFQPKDEKNQDSTELTGDINYRKIAEYGTDSRPARVQLRRRAQHRQPRHRRVHRGAQARRRVPVRPARRVQEHKIKPKKFAQTDIDEVILGHTNEPEYKKLQNNEFMEALPRPHGEDRRAVRHPAADEIKIYEKDFNAAKVRGKHIAPHTHRGRRDVGGADAAGGAQERRPDAAAEAEALQRQDAARLHRGQHQGAAARRPSARACTASARATSRTRSPTPWSPTPTSDCINPFMVLNELESGLQHHSLINSEEQRKHYKELLAVVKEEYEDIVKNEVQRAIAADEDALDAALRQLHRQRQGVHPAREGARTSTPASTRSRTSG